MAKKRKTRNQRRKPSNSAHPAGSSSSKAAFEAMVIEAAMVLGDEYDVTGITLPNGRVAVLATHIITGQQMLSEAVSIRSLTTEQYSFEEPPL